MYPRVLPLTAIAILSAYMLNISALYSQDVSIDIKIVTNQNTVTHDNEKSLVSSLSNITILLKDNQFVYVSSNVYSQIVDIIPYGKEVVLKQYGNWYFISNSDTVGWISCLNTSLNATNTSVQYKNLAFSIPENGVTNFTLVKIGDLYTVRLDRANTKKFLERLCKIEKKSIQIPYDLPSISLSESGISYYDLLIKVLSLTSSSMSFDGIIIPEFTSDIIIDKLKNGYLVNYSSLPEGIYQQTASHSDDDASDNLRPGACSFSTYSQNYNSGISYSDGKYATIDDNSFSLFNSTRGKLFTTNWEKGNNSSLIRKVFAHFDNSNFVIIDSFTIGSKKNVSVQFYDWNFRQLNQIQFQDKSFLGLLYSQDGKRVWITLEDVDSDIASVKTHYILTSRGDIIDKIDVPKKENIFYNKNLFKRIRFYLNSINITDIDTKTAYNTLSPVELRNNWQFSTGNESAIIANGNKLLSICLTNGSINSFYRLSEEYSFISVSENYSLLSSPTSSGTWSIIDLNSRRIIITKYKNDVFASYPEKIQAFPGNDRYLLTDSKTPTKYIIFGDAQGQLYKTKITESQLTIKATDFISPNILRVSTDSGMNIYLPIYELIKESEAIN